MDTEGGGSASQDEEEEDSLPPLPDQRKSLRDEALAPWRQLSQVPIRGVSEMAAWGGWGEGQVGRAEGGAADDAGKTTWRAAAGGSDGVEMRARLTTAAKGREASLAPWGDWGRGKLMPRAARRVEREMTAAELAQADEVAGPSPQREPLFEGVSEGARAAVLQFVLELKLRCFGSGRVLEQELRKHPAERRFLKLWPHLCPATALPKPPSWPVRMLTFVDGTMPQFEALLDRPRSGAARFVLGLLGSLLRGAGQAMLANNPIAGALALAGLGVTSAWLLVCSLVGLVVGTLFAMALGVNAKAIRAGLMGYNGLLLGGAMSVTMGGGDWNARALGFIFFGALFTVVAVLALGNAWASLYGAPAFTFPFIVITWLLVACMHCTTYFQPVAGLLPQLGAGLPIVHVTPTAGEFFASWMSGCGQIYIAGSPYSGALIVGGMFFYSRVSAIALMIGSLIGLAAAYMFGASSAAIQAGLWGYNPALLMIAMFGVFFVPSPKTFVLAVVGSFMSCFLSGALYVVLRPLGVPQLTFAFSFTALCFVLVQFSLSNVSAIPLAQVTTPESHWRKTRIIRAVLRRLRRKKKD